MKSMLLFLATRIWTSSGSIFSSKFWRPYIYIYLSRVYLKLGIRSIKNSQNYTLAQGFCFPDQNSIAKRNLNMAWYILEISVCFVKRSPLRQNILRCHDGTRQKVAAVQVSFQSKYKLYIFSKTNQWNWSNERQLNKNKLISKTNSRIKIINIRLPVIKWRNRIFFSILFVV